MQPFLEDGNLTPGIHTYTFTSFQEQFVLDFTLSESRTDIYEGFLKWIKELLAICPPRAIWIDGSFVTTKTDPNDIDIVLLYAPDDISNEAQSNKLSDLISRSETFQCDAYFCYTIGHLSDDEQTKFPSDFHIMEHYWKGFFSFNRNREPKGIIEITRQELLTEVI